MKIVFALCLLKLAAALHEDAFLKTPELIKKYGYHCEKHDVATEDGYILTNFRIPHGRTSTKAGKNPVLLQHGFLGTSDHWVMTSTESLSYRLADEGFDVWLMNTRGSEHALKHKFLNQKIDAEFWNYSLEEIGIYDLAATIDYVLNVTGKNRLFHVGQSQGTATLYILLSEKPEYNKKIIGQVSYTPVAFLAHTKGILFRAVAAIEKNYHGLSTARSLMGDMNISPVFDSIRYQVAESCIGNAEICQKFFESFVGTSASLNRTMLPVIFGHIFVSSSLKQCIHYIQLHLSGFFQKYDYGKYENLQKYGRETPPQYNFENILIPIHIFYGENDALVDTSDAENTAKALPNLQEIVKIAGYSHVDFYFADDVGAKVNAPTVEILQKYLN